MAIFNNMSITNKGKILYAKAQSGIELHFTKMMVGSGEIGTQNPETLTSLVTPIYDVGIQSITPNTELKTATISGMINNSNISEPTYVCEIGLFATDPTDGEILYAYGSAGQYGDYMAPSTSGPYSWNYQINAAIGNAANVTVELSNLVYDYGVINTNTTFIYLSGGNQKEINKSVDNMFKMYQTTNAGNIYSISSSNITTLKEGLPITIKVNADSTGATSLKINTLNAVLIKKANGSNVTNLKNNGIYNLRYNATTANFILLGEGGGGTATPDKILNGETATTDSGDVTGTIPSKSVQTYTPSTVNQTIAANQYLSGAQTILGDSELIASNIIDSANIFGIQGTSNIQSLGGLRIQSGQSPIGSYTAGSILRLSGEGTETHQMYLDLSQCVSFIPKIVFGHHVIVSGTGSETIGGPFCAISDVVNGGFRILTEPYESYDAGGAFVPDTDGHYRLYVGTTSGGTEVYIKWTILG